MKRKEFFNLGLFLEDLRRVRLPGIIFLVLLTLEAIIIPLGYVIDEYSMLAIDSETYTITATSISALEAHPLLLGVFIVAAPVLTFTMFSFLNKRNASDFYHSLPHTRLSIFVSKASALVTWIAGLILVTSGISRLFMSFFPDVFSVLDSSYLSLMLGCFSASLLVCATIIIAMSITGTVFSNITVTGLIMFFPRYVILFIINAVSDIFPLVPTEYISPLLSTDINMLTGMVMGYLFGTSASPLLTLTSQIYTLVLSLVYFALGAFLFCRRKSESADRSAPNRILQTIYRICIAMVVCTPVCYGIVTDSLPSDDWFLVFVLYLIAALAYFIYELVTTRKWKNLLRALPGLAIVAVLNVALVLTVFGIAHVEKSFSPDAEDIEYIQIVTDRKDHGYKYRSFYDFAKAEASSIRITSEKAISTVAEALEETIEYHEAYGTLNYVYHYYDKYETEDSVTAYKPSYTLYTFKIKTGTSTNYRTVRLSEEDVSTIMSALAEEADYSKAYLLLPEAQRNTVNINFGGIGFDEDVAYDIFKVMQNEVRSLDFESWYECLESDNNGTHEKRSLASIEYSSNGVTLWMPICAEVLPKTSETLISEALKLESYTAEEILPMLDKDYESKVEMNFSSAYIKGEDGVYEKFYTYGYGHDQNFFDALANAIDEEKPIYGDSIIILELFVIGNEQVDPDGYVYYEEYESHFAVLKLKDDAKELLDGFIN